MRNPHYMVNNKLFQPRLAEFDSISWSYVDVDLDLQFDSNTSEKSAFESSERFI
jgi:hypothetical protein